MAKYFGPLILNTLKNSIMIFKSDNFTSPDPKKRRTVKAIGVGVAAIAGGLASSTSPHAAVSNDKEMGELFQDHYKEMSKEEIAQSIERLEKRYKKQYDVDITVGNAPPKEDVLFGYALNISKCKGTRECVKACTAENNQDKDPNVEYIRVLEMDEGTMNLESADHYYPDDKVTPQPGKMYLPIQCHHCEDPPCVDACPVGATWSEPDGIVVVDYNWCIGCRMCANACPYWARKFNWREPNLPKEQINPKTHYLSNRPREKGVMEKCTFCLQRTREGMQPACQQACPTGARVFGNLLDPKSEIRYVLENKAVFRLKEDLNTQPKFWYYAD